MTDERVREIRDESARAEIPSRRFTFGGWRRYRKRLNCFATLVARLCLWRRGATAAPSPAIRILRSAGIPVSTAARPTNKLL
jgi:hypothetical protein